MRYSMFLLFAACSTSSVSGVLPPPSYSSVGSGTDTDVMVQLALEGVRSYLPSQDFYEDTKVEFTSFEEVSRVCRTDAVGCFLPKADKILVSVGEYERQRTDAEVLTTLIHEFVHEVAWRHVGLHGGHHEHPDIFDNEIKGRGCPQKETAFCEILWQTPPPPGCYDELGNYSRDRSCQVFRR